MTAAEVRTDRDPLTKRFPKLGDFAEAHWQGSLAGSPSSRVPGPSDVLIKAVVVLRPAELATAKADYDWAPAPAGWEAKISDELRPFAARRPPTGSTTGSTSWTSAPAVTAATSTSTWPAARHISTSTPADPANSSGGIAVVSHRPA